MQHFEHFHVISDSIFDYQFEANCSLAYEFPKLFLGICQLLNHCLIDFSETYYKSKTPWNGNRFRDDNLAHGTLSHGDRYHEKEKALRERIKDKLVHSYIKRLEHLTV